MEPLTCSLNICACNRKQFLGVTLQILDIVVSKLFYRYHCIQFAGAEAEAERERVRKEAGCQGERPANVLYAAHA